MATWDISETRSLIERTFGKKQVGLASPCIQSVIDRQYFARYHLRQAKSLLKRFQRHYLPNDVSLLQVTLRDPKAQMAFQVYISKVGAHVTAGLQSVHAIPDIIASGVYYSTGLNLGSNSIPERQIALNSVTSRLIADPRFGSVGEVLKQIPLVPNYAHLSAASNRSKHSSIVKTSMNEDLTGERSNLHELHLSSFEREGKHFPEIEVFSLVAPVYDQLSVYVVEAGNQLNASLRNIAP